MPYSTCCAAHTNYPEINICPECLDHCDWEEDEEEEQTLEEKQLDEETERAIEQEQINKQ
jgi:hypothetical protein